LKAAMSEKQKYTQRSSVALLTLAGLANYFDRGALAIANPLIRKELHVSIAQMGLLLSAFLWAYAFLQFPGGALVDRLGARKLPRRSHLQSICGTCDQRIQNRHEENANQQACEQAADDD
jgi:sugar phosphate permease